MTSTAPYGEAGDDTSLSGLADNGKHASLAVLTMLLEAILVGRSAEQLLGAGDLPEEAALFVAPRFGWMFAKIAVGRKEIGANGDRLLMPVHLEWNETLHLLADGETHTAEWLTSSMGHIEHGTTTVTTTRALFDAESDLDGSSIPTATRAPLESASELRTRLVTLAEQGHQAMWELKSMWESRVRSMVYKAHASSCIDISEYAGTDMVLLDETSIESIVDEFMYGEGEDPGKMHRVIEKVLQPQSMLKVDPLRYMNAAVRRDAAEAVRQRIGDNRVGRKVRAVARELGKPDVDAVVTAVRAMYPRDKISHDRVRAALTVGPDPMAGRWSDHHADGSSAQYADATGY